MEYRVIPKKFKDAIDLTFWLNRMGEKYWELMSVRWDKKGLSGLFIFKNEQCSYEVPDEDDVVDVEYYEGDEADGEKVIE